MRKLTKKERRRIYLKAAEKFFNENSSMYMHCCGELCELLGLNWMTFPQHEIMDTFPEFGAHEPFDFEKPSPANHCNWLYYSKEEKMVRGMILCMSAAMCE